MSLVNLLRKLRAAGGTAVIWSLAWGTAGAVVGLALAVLFREGAVTPLQVVRGTAFGFAAAGLVAGAAFSLVLGTVYRRWRLGNLRARRVGLWGMAGAMGLAYVGVRAIATSGGDMEPPVGMAILLTAGALGWATAAGAVRIAQAGERRVTPDPRDASLPTAAPGAILGAPHPAAEPLAAGRNGRQTIA